MKPHTPWIRTLVLAGAAAAAVILLLVAFLWPSLTSSVKSLPMAVVGTPAEVQQVRTTLAGKAAGAFTVTGVATRSEAIDLVRTRDVYGAIVLGQQPEVLTASADGPAVAQVLGALAAQLKIAKVTDVVPLASTDERGIGLSAASFPLVLGGILGGVLISVLVAGVWRRLLGVTAYSIVGGLAVVGVLQGWFGVLQGSYGLNSAAVALAMAGTASLVVGANALLGTPGIAVGAIITMLIGNPISSAQQPLQFMVAPWGAVGQWFVPGASATLARDLSYFPDANPTFAWLVLGGWTALGMIAMAAGHYRNQEVVHVEHAPRPVLA